MGIFGRGVDEKIDSLKELVSRNFSKFSEWIQYFQQKNNEQDARLAEIERKLANNPKNEHMNYVFSRINELENSRYSINEKEKLNFVYNKIHEIEQRQNPDDSIKALTNSQIQLINKIRELENRIAGVEQKPQQAIAQRPTTAHEKIVRKVEQRSKQYIKTAVMGLIKKYEKITGSQLKEIIVDEQGLCSKSSFYRILEEIEQEDKIKSERDGREKTYQTIQILR
jgi:hypothetical protein